MEDATAPDGATASETGLDAAFASAAAEVESTSNTVDDATIEQPTTDASAETPATEVPRFTVKVDGQELEVTQDELLAGYQRQSSFTRKSQELAAEREQLQIADAIWKKLQEDPAGTLEALQEHFETELRTEPLSAEEARLAAVEAHIEQQRQAELDAEINTEMDRLTAEYGQFDRLDLIQFAIDNQIGSLEAALALQLRTIERASGEQKRLAAKKAAPPVAGGTSVAAGAHEAPAADLSTIDACLAAAKAEHGWTD